MSAAGSGCHHGFFFCIRQWPSSITPRLPANKPLRLRISLSSRPQVLPDSNHARTYATKRPGKPRFAPVPSNSKATHVPLPQAASRPAVKDTAFPYDVKNLAAKNLASRSSPTLLFRSLKSPWWQVARALGAGAGVCYLGDYLYHLVWLEDLGLPIWVKGLEIVSMGGIAVALFYFAILFSKGPIGSISAKPVPGGLKMIIEGRPGPQIGPLQMWAPQRVECAISDVVLEKGNVLQHEVPTSIRERKDLFEKQKLENIRTSPLKQLFGKATRQRFRESFLAEKNMPIKIKNSRWNMDVRDGWLLDNGRVLQNLIKPDRERA